MRVPGLKSSSQYRAQVHDGSTTEAFGRVRQLASLALIGAALLHGVAVAQAPGRAAENSPSVDTVSWTVAAPSEHSVKQGSRLTLTLQGEVLQGWHVYALEQPSGGPIPLRVTLDPTEVAVADGAPTAATPTTTHDPSFNLETRYYAKPFTVSVPVRIKAQADLGPQEIPVSVRFQTCNGRICKPPKTVRVSARVNVRVGE